MTDILKNSIKISPCDYVFTNEHGNQWKRYKFDTAFARARKKAGIKNFRFHDCRHSAASYLVMMGIDLLTVKEILGHSKIEMVLKYAHLAPEVKIAAMKKMGDKISSLL